MKTIYKKEGTPKKECVEKSHSSQTTIIILAIISSMAIVLSVVAIAMHVPEDVVINDISIVLGFIGVLATFIVVTNYVQVWKLEQNVSLLEQKITQRVNQIDEQYDSRRRKLFMMHKRLIYTAADAAMYVDIDKAFLYLQDIFPILTELYGKNGDGKDDDGETISNVVNAVKKLLKQHSQDKHGGIKLKTLKQFQTNMEEYVPVVYEDIPEVKAMCQDINELIKQLSKNNNEENQ